MPTLRTPPHSVGGIINRAQLGEIFVNVRQWLSATAVHPALLPFLAVTSAAARARARSGRFEKGNRPQAEPTLAILIRRISRTIPTFTGSFVRHFTPLLSRAFAGVFHGQTDRRSGQKPDPPVNQPSLRETLTS